MKDERFQAWLEQIGLGQFADVFEEEGIDLDVIGEYTEEELKGFGLKSGHYKRLMKALRSLVDEPREFQRAAAPEGLHALANTLPAMVALPLKEYVDEEHPGMTLWAACDTVELLLRLLVIISVAERQSLGLLDEKLLKQMWGKIEMPTLGAWMAMARSLSAAKANVNELLLPELPPFIDGPLTEVLYGVEKPRSPETSLLELRNRLAHGGGLTRKEAERLLDIWRAPFEKLIDQLFWLSDIKVQGVIGNRVYTLHGASSNYPEQDVDEAVCQENQDDGVWLTRGQDSLPLWPLVLFSLPSAPEAKGRTVTGDTYAPQVYVRKDTVRLRFTPMGLDDFSYSEADESALEAFQALFKLDRAQQQAAEKGFKVQDFSSEIQKDAGNMVGRFEEQAHIEACFKDRDQSVVWLTGPAGIGKSFLVARLAQDLIDRYAGTDTIVLAYRFKSGDDTRCHREAFVTYVIERLLGRQALVAHASIDERGKAEERLKSCLDLLAREKRLILILDGLDELVSRDRTFAEDIPLALRYPRLTWFCAGRPESSLQEAFRINQAIMPYPGGLPPMRQHDIRGMLLEKIGPLRKKLLKGDKEKGDDVVNPFIELVSERAAGLPLYVKYVIDDVLANRYRVLDGNENLPDSLHAYHEQLIDSFGIGDLKAVLTPLAATLAVAHEPLSEHEIVTFLRLRKIITETEEGDQLLLRALAELAPMLRRAPDPEGEEGFTLFHGSLREHMLSTPAMSQSIATAREAMARAALEPDEYPTVVNYLYRVGVDHLLDVGKVDKAKSRLLDLNALKKMVDLGKGYPQLFAYWRSIGDESPGTQYVRAIETLVARTLCKDDLSIFRELTNFCDFAGWYSESLEIAERSISAHSRLLDLDHSDLVVAQRDLAFAKYNMGKFEEAEPMFRSVLEAHERTLGADHPETMVSVAGLALLLGEMGKFSEAEQFARRDYDTSLRLMGPDHVGTLTAMTNLSVLLRAEADFAEAEPLARVALESKERLLGPDHPSTLTSMNNLALLFSAKGDFERAEPLYRRAIKLQEGALGPDHPNTLFTKNNLGVLLKKNQNLEGAEDSYRQVIAGLSRSLGNDHPHTLTSISNLALLLEQRGDFDASEPLLHQVLEGRVTALGPSHADTLSSVFNLADLLRKIRKYEQAEPLYRQLLDSRERALGPNHKDTLGAAYNLGRLFLEMERFDDAERHFLRELRGLEQLLGVNHPEVLESTFSLGEFYAKRGDYEKAGEMFLAELEGCTQTLGDEDEGTLISAQNYGVFLRDKLDDPARALTYLQRVYDVRRRAADKGESKDLASAAVALGTAFNLCGEAERALAYLGEGAEIRRTLAAGGDEGALQSLANTLPRLVEPLEKLGRHEQLALLREEITSLS